MLHVPLSKGHVISVNNTVKWEEYMYMYVYTTIYIPVYEVSIKGRGKREKEGLLSLQMGPGT